MYGIVTAFKPEKGYGFIQDMDGNNYFVHHSNIIMSGFKMLEPGQEVVFDVGQDEGKPNKVALRVRTEQKGAE